jgi:hypothetical protein
MRSAHSSVSLAIGCVLSACYVGENSPRADSVSTVIGASGGNLSLSRGATLQIPPGALAKDTTITIARSSAQAPDGALTAVYEFGPAGLVFAKTVTVTFPVPDGTTSGSVYWTAVGSDTYEELPTSVQGAMAFAQVAHFSRGFVGRPCSAAGSCPARRDVTGAFERIFWTDDGTKTRVGVPQPGVTVSALVPSAGGVGYQHFPGTFAADGISFTIHGVPEGRYFLQVEGMPDLPSPSLFELTTSTPDLSSVVAYRRNLVRPVSPTPVTVNVTNLDPYTPGDSLVGDLFEIGSSQANLSLRPWSRSGGPAAGDTSFSGPIDWHSVLNVVSDNAVGGLPDASKGDVVWFYQAKRQIIGPASAPTIYRPATKAARISNLTMRDGVAASVDVPLVAVPQTGRITADVRYSQFAALAPAVNPGARSNELAFNVFAIPHGAGSPDEPGDSMSVRPLLLAHQFTTGPAFLPDTNYGTLAYGQFSDTPLWQESRQTLYVFDVTVAPPGGTAFTLPALIVAVEPISSAPIAPGIGPVRSPQINGRDLFQPQTGVGLQPTISWSPPGLGAATDVLISISAMDGSSTFQATVQTGKSFTVPDGVLVAGKTYVTLLTAQQTASGNPNAPPLRLGGVPFYSADCITSTFTP